MTTTQTLRTSGVSAARDFQELPAWQKAVSLAEQVYGATNGFPAREHAGLAAQMRATVLEVAASIAAASGRNNEFGMTDSYSKAQSSNAELMTQITLASRLGFLDMVASSELLALLDEVSRLIVALKHGLKVAAKDAERAERMEREAAKAEREERPRREFKSRDGEDRPRREYKPRDGGDERPRREFKPRDRDGEDRPRREYKPRDGGEDRPRREYKPHDNGGEDRPRREYKPRDGGDRKPYGDKKQYGDKKPFGKKPFGGKSGGGKPFRKPRD